MKSVDIIVPVYDGFEETWDCLASVLATMDASWARLIVINDSSPSPQISAHLRDLAQQHPDIVLLENEENLGFVATVNRGMQYDTERDVLLLNSDVEVANNWLERMREAAYANAQVASLTPYSNNATICSFPNYCEDNELLYGLSVAELDSWFADNFTATDVIPVPTGVGFCMYIRRDCLSEVGYFDVETFGKGYGEENDWCQRAERMGWQNYHLANCFVYHKGGVSFGASQNPRIAKALELLAKKHPGYDADVQDCVAKDAGKEQRIQALLGLFARQHQPKIALVSHKLGGGAQQHVNELASFYSDKALFVQITPYEDGRSITLSLFSHGCKVKDSLHFEVDTQYDELLCLLQELGVGHLHFHHTMGLHPRIWGLSKDLKCDYDLTIHDYYLVNGNPTMTDGKAHFIDDDADNFDQRCADHYPLPEGVSAQAWREGQRPLVEGARRVIFPSMDCRQHFQRFFVVPNPVVAWHPDYLLSQPFPAPNWHYDGSCPLKVLVLGALSREKGADVLEAVASSLQQDAIEFHLLGYAYQALAAGVITHGPYQNENVHELIAKLQPDVVWFPALWPETYSYTLSIALHAGLPVVVPNVGAFGERVQGRALSVVRPWNASVDYWFAFWRDVLKRQALPDDSNTAQATPVVAPGDSEFYGTRYLQAVRAMSGQLSVQTLARVMVNHHREGAALSSAERLLKYLWMISRSRWVARLVSLIPFRLRQAVKRRLSNRPMHDIVHRR